MTIVQLKISGKGRDDAPLLEDLVGQIEDFFAMIDGIAAAIDPDHGRQYDWEVVGLSKQSPATITVVATARPDFPNGAQIANEARRYATAGLWQLRRSNQRPRYFDDNILDAAERFTQRVGRRVRQTEIVGDAHQTLKIRPETAVKTQRHIIEARETLSSTQYKELGSLEGQIERIGTDGWGRPYIVIKNRVTLKEVKCFLKGEALRALEEEPVAEVLWRNRRVSAFGELAFRNLGILSQAYIDRLEFAISEAGLPDLKELIDRDYTNGLSSADYIERVRSGAA